MVLKFFLTYGKSLIEGASAQAHIDHNIVCSNRGEHWHKIEIMSITY